MNHVKLLKQMVDQGLKIDTLPSEIAEAIYVIQDLSDDFTNDDNSAIELADKLLGQKANYVTLIEAMPERSILRREFDLEIDHDALSIEKEQAELEKEAARFERTMQKRIKAAKTVEEIEALREELDEEDRFENLQDDPIPELHEDLTEREATLKAVQPKQPVKEPQKTPVLPEKKPTATVVAKKPETNKWQKADDLKIQKNKEGDYPRKFERDGKTYVRHLFFTDLFHCMS